MTAHELNPQEKEALLDLFSHPMPADWLGDPVQMPSWFLAGEDARGVLLRNASWAVCRVRVEGDLTVGVEVLDPAAARAVWRRNGSPTLVR